MFGYTSDNLTAIVYGIIVMLLGALIIQFPIETPQPPEPELVECIELQYTYMGGQLHYMDYCFDDINNYPNFQQSVIRQFNAKHNIDSSGICCKDHVCVNNKFDVCVGNSNP
jgi:hypothetical protein